MSGPDAAAIAFKPAPAVAVVEPVVEEPKLEPPVVDTLPPPDVETVPDPVDEPVAEEKEVIDEPPPEDETVDEPATDTTDDEPPVASSGSGGGGSTETVAADFDGVKTTAFDRAGGLLKSWFVKPAAMAALSAPTFAVPSFELDNLATEIRTVLASNDFNDSLDRMREEVLSDTFVQRSVIGSSVAVTTGLSVGYVAWLVRGGVLLSTALSSLPAWQFVDPLPVLARTRDGEDGDDDDSLQSIIEEQSSRADEKTKASRLQVQEREATQSQSLIE